jgi:hypothetical protein
MHSDQEKGMVQYLLGQLPEQEQAEFETLYLADDTCFEELLAIEDGLRDAYARGELSGRDREAFEQRLLATPQQRQKQEFARTLRSYLVDTAASDVTLNLLSRCQSLLRALAAQPRIIIVPALSVSLLLLAVAAWRIGRRSGQPLASAPARMAPRTPGTGASQPGGPPNQPQTSAQSLEPETRTVAFVLSPGSVRGSGQESNSLVIPAGVRRVRLEARFEGDYLHCEAVLETADNKRIWSEGRLKAEAFPGGKRVFIDLSSSLLFPGDYILTLRGLPASGPSETIAEYAFNVGSR